MKTLAFAMMMSFAGASYGAQLPVAGDKDARVRFATYDPHDVVTIYTGVGLETHIVLDPGERIIDMTGGDTDAWGVASKQARNGVFLKPTAELPDANLHIVTDKRTYSFDLKLAKKSKKEIAFMTVFFKYPDQKATVDAQAIAAKAAADEQARLKALLDAGEPAANRRYSVQGSSDLAPVEAWDDGRTTFLRFRARSSIPAIYSARGDDDSIEQIENVHTRDDILQVQGVRRKLMLRIGQQVACVFNEGYDPNAQRPVTNTVSPGVTRALKGVEK